jgi:hypothetical protein
VSVIPLSREEQARATEAHLATLQEAREVSDALIRDILEEGPAGTTEPDPDEPRASSSQEEDWPSELHPLPLPND